MKAVGVLKSFTDHLGIPGHQGGSLPRDVTASNITGGKAASLSPIDLQAIKQASADASMTGRITPLQDLLYDIGYHTEGDLLSNSLIGPHDWATFEKDHKVDPEYVRSRTKHDIVVNLSKATGLDERLCDNILASWSVTSNDESLRPLSLQQAISEEFGIPLSKWQTDNIKKALAISVEADAGYRRSIEDLYNDMNHATPYNQEAAAGEIMATYIGINPTNGEEKEFLKTYRAMSAEEQTKLIEDTIVKNHDSQVKAPSVFWIPVADRQTERKAMRAMYAITQEKLQSLGYKPDETVRLFRGVTAGVDGTLGNIVGYKGNTAESWSLSPKVAFSFASGHVNGGKILAIDVPVKSILATATTGFGCLPEGEVVVMGNTDTTAQVIFDVADIYK